MTEAVRVSGLDRLLAAGLAPWRKPRTVHDPAKVVVDLAIALGLGGDCLADIGLLRAEPGLFGLVASDPTVSRTIDALAKDASAALKAINTARAAARARVWEFSRRECSARRDRRRCSAGDRPRCHPGHGVFGQAVRRGYL